MSHAGALFDTQIYGGEVALAQLLLELVFLIKSVCGTFKWISEDEPRLLEDRKFVSLLQFATLVPAN
jgi:hypothetical protein